MANPFDQFDKPGANPFDQFDGAATAVPDLAEAAYVPENPSGPTRRGGRRNPAPQAEPMPLGESLFERAQAGLTDVVAGGVRGLGEFLDPASYYGVDEDTAAVWRAAMPQSNIGRLLIDEAQIASEVSQAKREAASVGAIAPTTVEELVSMALEDPEGAARYFGGIGAESAPAILAAMATRNPRAAEAMMGATSLAQTFGQQRMEGVSGPEASRQAVAAALIEAASSRVPADIALGGAPLARRAVVAPLAEAASEAGAGGAQSVAQDVIAGRPVDAASAELETLVGALVGAPMGLGEAVLGRGPQDQPPAPAMPLPPAPPAAAPSVPPAPAPAPAAVSPDLAQAVAEALAPVAPAPAAVPEGATIESVLAEIGQATTEPERRRLAAILGALQEQGAPSPAPQPGAETAQASGGEKALPDLASVLADPDIAAALDALAGTQTAPAPADAQAPAEGGSPAAGAASTQPAGREAPRVAWNEDMEGVHTVRAADGRLMGNILTTDLPGAVQIDGIEIGSEFRGQGAGVALYRQLADRALADGKVLRSDPKQVSPDAQRMYDALERRGYTVERLPNGEGGTQFIVTAAPGQAQPEAITLEGRADMDLGAQARQAEAPAPARAEPEAERPKLSYLMAEIGWEERGGRLLRERREGDDDITNFQQRATGDVIGRTKWVPKLDPVGRPSTFWRDRPMRITEAEAREALRRADAGEPLSRKQQRFVDYAIEHTRDFMAEGEEEAQRMRESGFDPNAIQQQDGGQAQDGPMFDDLGDMGFGDQPPAPDYGDDIPFSRRSQPGLFGEPTAAEQVLAERRRRDAERDGRTGTGRTDMAAGEGDLFAGPRPAQADIEDAPLGQPGNVRRQPRPPSVEDQQPSQLAEDARMERVLEQGRLAARRLAADTGELAQAITRALGPAARQNVTVVGQWADLPPDVRRRAEAAGLDERAEGFFDPRTGRAYVLAGPEMTPERAVWVAFHETAGHLGLRAAMRRLAGDGPMMQRLVREFDRAGRNATVAQIARAIRRQNPDYGRLRSLEEALSELAAANRTGNWQEIQSRYGVAVPPSMRPGLRSMLDAVLDAIRQFLRALAGRNAAYTDGQVVRLLEDAWRDAQKVGQAALESEAMLSREDGDNPVFYSALLEAVEGAQGAPRRGDAKAWKGWLDGAQRRGEIKQGERDWLGVDAWLEGRGTTTREELADFIRANQVQVQDVVLQSVQAGEAAIVSAFEAEGWSVDSDDMGIMYIDPDGEIADYNELPDSLKVVVDEASQSAGDVKYQTYQLPGGQNYRELLLTIPANEEVAYQVIGAFPQDGFATEDEANDYIDQRVRASQMPGMEPIADQIRQFPMRVHRYIKSPKSSGSFVSSHFDQPNILAHVRFNERTDADGRRVLFIEEIQSDWHQAGRKRGYAKPVEELASLPSDAEAENRNGRWFVRVPSITSQFLGTGNTRAEANADALRSLNQSRRAEASNNVPDAPFKATDEWAMLAFKRMARWAVDNGFDRIAWTTGEQQAERYDMSRQVESISVPTVDSSGGRSVDIKTTNSTSFKMMVNDRGIVDGYAAASQFSGKPLDEVIGKEMAEKVMAAEAGTVLSGADLKIGGEGMRAFYDKILPSAVNKWAKKFGGKVGRARFADEEAALYPNLVADKPGVTENGTFPAHALDITPAMREAVSEGLPLFSRAPPTDSAAFKRWFGDSKVVDEDGKPLVVYHGTTANFDAFDRRRSNVESDFGAGFYFSNTRGDVGSNYAGLGPDLTNKIEREAERLAGERGAEWNDPEIIAEARSRFVTNEGLTMPVFLSIKNPVVVGGRGETTFDYREEYNEELDEYGEPSGSLVEFIDGLRESASAYDGGDVEAAIQSIMEDAYDGEISASRLIDKLKDSEEFFYYTDDNGDVAASEIIRQAFERAGFDGIIDRSVDVKFGSQRRIGKKMEGMTPDTVHYIAFRPNQIKSATGNRGTFDPDEDSILFSRRRPTQGQGQLIPPATEQEQRNAALTSVMANRTGLFGRLAAMGYPQGALTQQQPGGRFLPVRQAIDEARRKLQDRMLPLRRAQEDVAGPSVPGVTTPTLEDGMNAYRLENLMHGAVADKLRDVDERFILRIQRMMKNGGVSVDQLQDYLLARHAPERNARIASINPAMPDGGAGVTTQEARDILAGTAPGPYSGAPLDAETRRKAAAIAAVVDQMRQETLDYMVKAGLVTPQMAQTLLARYPNYVPLRGWKGEDSESGQRTGRGLQAVRNAIRRALGRRSLADNLLGEMAGDLQRAIVASEKAKVGRALLRFALANPMPDLYTVEPVELEWKFSEATGEAYLGIRNSNEDLERSLVVKADDGTPVRIRFEDDALAQAIVNMNPLDAGGIVRALGAVNRWRSAVLTRYNPAFAPVNMARDALFGVTAISAEKGADVAAATAATYPMALAAMWRDARRPRGRTGVPAASRTWDDWARSFAALGGKTGITRVDDVADLQRKMADGAATIMELAAKGRGWAASREAVTRALKPVADFIEAGNDATENAIRLAVYRQLVLDGESEAKAAEYAKNVTINFNRKGEWGPALNAIYLFYNAAMQGSHATLRVMRNPKVAAFLGSLAVLQGVLASAMMGADDDEDGITAWDKVPDYVKRTSLVVPLGWATGNMDDYFALPMPYGFNLVTYGGGRGAQYMVLGERPTDTSIASDLFTATMDAFSPVPVTDGARSVFGEAIGFAMGLYANEDDFGRPVVADRYAPDYVPRALLGRADTPQAYHMLARGLAKLGGGDLDKMIAPVGPLDIAPEQLEALWNFATGGVGSIFNRTIRGVEQAQAGNINGVMELVSATPIANRFVARGNTGRAIAERYYREAEEMERNLDVLKERVRQEGVSDFDAIMAELQADEPALAGVELDRYKRSGRWGEAGAPKLTDTGAPRLRAARGSPMEAYRAASRETEDLNRLVRQLRVGGQTQGDLARIIDENTYLQTTAVEALGLPAGFDPEAPATSAQRNRAIRLVQDFRAQEQQGFIRAMNQARNTGRDN